MARSRQTSGSGQTASRREFLKAAGAVTVAATVGPAIHADDKSGRRLPIVGQGEYTYEVEHDWGQLPAHLRWGDTHGVCVDASGAVYIKHLSSASEPMDAIVVFDAEGRYVRSFGREYHGGGHGIDVRDEGGQEFLYLCDIKNREVIKTSLEGEQVWKRGFPAEANVYQRAEQYRPTNVAFAPDGGFYVGDGYGSHYIHQYDAQARWIRTWGGQGSQPGQLRTPHGLWLDDRPGREPALVVADRANARLQYFSLAGDLQQSRQVDEVSFPAHFDIRGDVLLVPDLHARVTLLDRDNRVLAHLGYDADWTQRVLSDGLRNKPDEWQPGRFIHPHDACFDAEGNLLVVEWVPMGRVSRLRRVG